MAIKEQWAELLTPGLRSIFHLQVDALSEDSKIPQLFNVGSSTKAAESYLGAGGLGNWKKYNGAIEYDDMNQGYKTTITHNPFIQGFKVERELYDDDQYNIINARPVEMALGAVRTKEEDAADIFNNAFDSGLGADSQYLCDGAHPYSPANTASTQSNAGSSALSRDSIIATRKLMRKFTDDRGKKVRIMPDTLLVPPELEDVAWVETKSEFKTGSADNDRSYVNSLGLNVVVWPELTDANNWFLIDSKMAKIHNHFLNRIMPEFELDPASNFQLEARYRGYMRYSMGWSDFKWVYGHLVA